MKKIGTTKTARFVFGNAIASYFGYLILFAMLVLASSRFPSASSTALAADKPVYAPGDTVFITGSNFAPNTAVTLTITLPDTTTYAIPPISSDDAGAFSYSYLLSAVEGPYTASASDGVTSAQTQFTVAAAAPSAAPTPEPTATPTETPSPTAEPTPEPSAEATPEPTASPDPNTHVSMKYSCTDIDGNGITNTQDLGY
ncbi:MAG: hypothetical protein V1708_02535, partial [Candidatus Micrarchaeota archaeon]